MIAIVKADLTRTEHAQALVQLLNEYACDPMGGGVPLSEQVQKSLIGAMSSRPHLHSFIAYDAERPVGLMNTVEGFSTFSAKPLLNIHDVMVNRDYRGRGIAAQLFDAAEAFARSLGCCKMTLEVLEGNQPARASYTRLGFKPYQLDPEAGVAQFWEKKI
ncbi:MAG: GNAT family N-acetyltransferase [Nitrincola lacisaponensis]|uniref:Acetyltransferase, GNAT family n=1 Tax=Nitrincola lacisaponensis TaxID=267850 RepID=A0A063Y6G7_9GAMM|nr:GNAT family N-acetyltransferase [Nitrincola lacisaponensis]KDE41304.1 Acetyltransferase, GNAT family [Nitrincola lacisaponensis]